MSAPSIVFLGTGEAFDALPHTSLLVRAAGTTLLLDCGAQVPPALWQQGVDGRTLDGVWISHLHADHLFGLAAVLGRCWEDDRRRPLTLLGAAGVRAAVEAVFEHGYPGLRRHFAFGLEEVVVEPGAETVFGGLRLRSAESAHSLRNLSLRVEAEGAAPLCYSGDGAPTEASAELARGAVWVHECFSLDGNVPGHATLRTLEAELPRRAPRRLALVHVGRRFRDAVAGRCAELAAAGLPVSLPAPGEVWQL